MEAKTTVNLPGKRKDVESLVVQMNRPTETIMKYGHSNSVSFTNFTLFSTDLWFLIDFLTFWTYDNEKNNVSLMR